MNLDTAFNFIKEKRGYEYPLKYKLINGIPLTEKELHIDGHLDLSYTNNKSLPDGLRVGRDLDIAYSKVISIPNNLYIGGDFLLYNTPLSMEYNEDEIMKMIIDKGGYLGGSIYWW